MEEKMMEKRKRIFRKTKEVIYIRDKGICQICGNQISFSEMIIDHICPLSRGGEDNIYNFQCCCRQCNALKQDWTMNELYEKTVDIFWYQTRKRTGSEYTDMLLECIRKTGPRRDL